MTQKPQKIDIEDLGFHGGQKGTDEVLAGRINQIIDYLHHLDKEEVGIAGGKVYNKKTGEEVAYIGGVDFGKPQPDKEEVKYGDIKIPQCDPDKMIADSQKFKPQSHTEEWCEKEEWGGWKIVSDMLDHPENGIYPTSKCYEELYHFVCSQKEKALHSERDRVREWAEGKSKSYIGQGMLFIYLDDLLQWLNERK